MGLLNPGQNYDHLLDVISGYDGMHDLQYHAVPEDGIDPFFRGALLSLNAAGEYQLGLSGVAAGEMPMWAINARDDFDVNSDIGNVSGARTRQDGQLLGGLATFVATGGFEIATTEFDPAAVASYVPNRALIHDAANPGYVTAGATPYAIGETIVGTVSKGVRTEVYGQSVLQFWPVFLPARV
jgi:hypothetical protein